MSTDARKCVCYLKDHWCEQPVVNPDSENMLEATHCASCLARERDWRSKHPPSGDPSLDWKHK